MTILRKKIFLLIVLFSILLISNKTFGQVSELVKEINSLINKTDYYSGNYSTTGQGIAVISRITYNDSSNNITFMKELRSNAYSKLLSEQETFDLDEATLEIITASNKNFYSKKYLYKKNIKISCASGDCIFEYDYNSGRKNINNKMFIYSGSDTYTLKLHELLARLKESTIIKEKTITKPILIIENISIDETVKNKKIDIDETFIFSITIKNIGNYTSKNAFLITSSVDDLGGLDYNSEIALGDIASNKTRIIAIAIKTNKNTNAANAKFTFELKDEVQTYGIKKNVEIAINVPPAHPLTISKLPDVDLNIPKNEIDNNNVFCLVIGNENYKYSTNVNFATNDANIMFKYLNQTIGIPQKNIFLLKDASRVEINDALEKLKKITQLLKGNTIIFYYAGHGKYNENRNATIIPVDVAENNPDNGITLNYVIEQLNIYKPKKVFAFFDACFIGTHRDTEISKDVRGVKIKPKSFVNDYENTVVFTSSSIEQSSYSYPEKQHGMFTYYILRFFQETKGSFTMGQLKEYLDKNIPLNSILINNYLQNPQIIKSINNTKWENWELN